MGHSRSQPDHYSKRAKREGHAARSIYKLEEIDQRWRIIRGGNIVLDLGCAPGSWMQYASKQVGPRGQVIGFDLKPIGIGLPNNVTAHVGDIYHLDIESLPPCNVVLSDMAPNTTGNRSTDALQSAALAEHALYIAQQVLCVHGCVVVKVLEGGDVPNIIKGMRQSYTQVQLLRPKATRKRSTEIFLIGIDNKLPTATKSAHE